MPRRRSAVKHQAKYCRRSPHYNKNNIIYDKVVNTHICLGKRGQLPADLDAWTVDLRGDPPAGETPLDAARRLAIGRFRDQLSKARLDPSVIREASLSWSREEPTVGWQCEHEAQGHRVSVRARAVTDLGRTIEQARSVFVARHDPNRERRRLPIHWGR